MSIVKNCSQQKSNGNDKHNVPEVRIGKSEFKNIKWNVFGLFSSRYSIFE